MNYPMDEQDTEVVIEAIFAKPVTSEASFIAGRYPYTYGYDFLRSHAEDFGLPEHLSRAECAGLFHDREDKEAIVTRLADAYLREWKIVR